MPRPNGNQLKKEIRKAMPELKHHDLSVRYECFSMGSSYEVAVKKFVPLSKIKQVVNQYKSISRCHASGEILSGGNTYTSIDYMSWNRSKDESFTVEVPEEVMNEVEALIPRFSDDSWKGFGGRSSRMYHFTNTVAKECKTLEGWSEEDVRDAVHLISGQSEALHKFFETGETPEKKSENSYAECVEYALGI